MAPLVGSFFPPQTRHALCHVVAFGPCTLRSPSLMPNDTCDTDFLQPGHGLAPPNRGMEVDFDIEGALTGEYLEEPYEPDSRDVTDESAEIDLDIACVRRVGKG